MFTVRTAIVCNHHSVRAGSRKVREDRKKCGTTDWRRNNQSISVYNHSSSHTCPQYEMQDLVDLVETIHVTSIPKMEYKSLHNWCIINIHRCCKFRTHLHSPKCVWNYVSYTSNIVTSPKFCEESFAIHNFHKNVSYSSKHLIQHSQYTNQSLSPILSKQNQSQKMFSSKDGE